jgi:ribonuclease G
LSYELLLSCTPTGDRIALLDDKRLVEYHQEENAVRFKVGDIYLGIVRKVDTSMNAAFVDIGHERDGFLHYLDLGPNIPSMNKFVKNLQTGKQDNGRLDGFQLEKPIDKLGKMTDVYNKNSYALVQVTKEAISTKGPRLSCEISLAGRFLILVPFSESINISKRVVNKEERQRLTRIVKALKPSNFGVIIRTAAEGQETEEIEQDLLNMIAKWDAGMEKLKLARPRDIVIGELSRRGSLLRDMLNADFETILVDQKEAYDEIKQYVTTIAPEKEGIVRLYNGKNKLFEQYAVEKQIKSLFGKTVSLPGGGYIVIEHTEALHSIDVNSGSSSKRNAEDQEGYNLQVNSEAAREVARQLRLRDMGGIIIVDFIDQRKSDNKRLIYDKMKDEMKDERAKHSVLPLTKFGLMQITRERVRPETNVVTSEVCPTCHGSGAIQASILVTDQIEQSIEFVLEKQNQKGLNIQLHPYLHAYFTKGLISRQMEWWWKYKQWITLQIDSSLGITDFRFISKSGAVIDLEKN